MVPMINTRAEAEAVVRACKYPPAGERSFGGPAAHLSFGFRSLAEYQAGANEQTMVIIQLETMEAVKVFTSL
jgi:4-hydroxy-2-oxoheptanedioate aldolase